MQFQLKIFEYEDNQRVRTVEIDGEIWFILSDVGRALELENPANAAARLDDDEKGVHTMDTPGGRQRVRIISESGLYTLILTSRKPSARKFKRWVTHEVLPEIRRVGSFGINRHQTPIFVRRFNDNWDRVDTGYFSVISELFIRVYGRFERVGYLMPDRGDTGREMRPDIAVGKRFASWLRSNHPHLADQYEMYDHLLPDGSVKPARQYVMEVLPVFNRYVDEVWLPEHGPDYFRERDRKALNYLPALLPRPRRRVS